MKIVVIGGTGLIGTKVVAKLRTLGHQVIAAAPNTGINTLTGEGLAEALQNTDVVIDLANSPSFEDKAVLEFFQTAGHNLLAAETNAGVKHHVALSIVGVDIMQNVGYMRGKKAQEDIVRKSGVPYTIVRSTQFLEFLAGIANQATEGNIVHISDVLFQPIAAEDVASFVADAALAAPIDGVTEIAGPERFTMPEIVALYLQGTDDPRKVVPNSKATYYGGEIPKTALVPAGPARLGTINFKTWPGPIKPGRSTPDFQRSAAHPTPDNLPDRHPAVTIREQDQNTYEGSEFLDDSLRMDDWVMPRTEESVAAGNPGILL